MATTDFINAVKAKEILWNPSHLAYNNRQQTQIAWAEIGNQFNLPSSECKKKWKALRAALCRQNRKVIDEDLPPSKGISKWKHANDLNFLLPLINKRKSLSLAKECDSSAASDEETDTETTPFDPVEIKTEDQINSTTNGNHIPLFIEAVQRQQILWNCSDPNFNNSELSDHAWNEIELTLGIPAEDCKKKWNCIKAYLASECAKHPDNRSSWTYFKQLDFVRPFLEQDNIQPITEQNDSYKAPISVVSETKPDFPELVIAEVKKYPLLWNSYNKNYKSIYKKLKAWRKIANSLEASVEDVKKKWKALRDLFARAYVKNPDANSNNWAYFQQMLFLAPFLKCRQLSFVKSFEQQKESDDEDSISSTWDSDNNETKPVKLKKKEENTFPNEEFIEEIKKRRILWDSTFKTYNNNKLRSVVWKEVAFDFSLSVLAVKKKWKVIRDLFIQNYLKPIKEEDKHWKYYNQLKFLAPHLREKKDDVLGSHIKIEAEENSISSSEESQNDDEKNAMTIEEAHVKEFINLMKQHELLWNLNHKNYKKYELRVQAWEEIAEHFSLPKIDECRKKWKALRDTFTKSYYKPIREEDKCWKYYKDMKFLIPNLKYKKGIKTQEEEADSDGQDFKIKAAEKHVENIKEELSKDGYSNAFEEIEKHEVEPKTPEANWAEEFINVVKQHEILWNTNEENYNNHESRNNEWQKIAVHFNSSVEECKKKWKALRDSFVRNYFKPIKEKYKVWNHYAELKFLGPHVKYKKGKSLVGDSEFERRNDDSFSSSLEDEKQLSSSNIFKKFTVKEFVNEIKKHTILWDLSDERCKMKKYRLQAWKEISTHFCLSALECKRKWATLRSAFIREFAKYPDNDTWKNFKELDFLLPYLKANVSANNELDAPETDIPLDEATHEPTENISVETAEINSDSQSIYPNADESWIENFILAVKQQKILWDIMDINYKNALKRQQAWNKIAKEFGLSIDDSKQKWNSLRETFAVYLNNDESPEENSKWKYYNDMAFLRPHLKVKRLGEIGYEVNNDSDSCSPKEVKLQMHANTINELSTVEFINSVKEKEFLYNWAQNDHKDKIKVEKAWQQIANKFKTSIPCCKERWLELQNGYTRVILSHSIDRKFAWQYLEEMDFLRPFIKTSMDSPNFVAVSGCLSFDDIIEDSSFHEEPMVANDDQDEALYEELFECSPSEFAQNIERNEVRLHNSTEPERAAVKRRKHSYTSSDDEDREFYHNLKEKMKKLPSDVKRDAKGHIQAYLKVVASNHSS